MSIWKILLTFPYLFLSFRKAKVWCRKIYRDPNSILEETRYHWLRRKIRYLLWLFNIKIVVKGWKNWTSGPLVILSNHQTEWDPLLIFALNDFRCHAPCAFIAKKELIKTKVRYFAALINLYYIDRANPRSAYKVFQKASDAVRIPRALVVFPEGTRSKHPPTLMPFKAGICKIPKKSYAPILPCTIVNSYQVKRWNIIKLRSYVLIVFGSVVKPQSFVNKPEKQLMFQIQKQVQKNLDQYQNVSHQDLRKYYREFKAEKKALKRKK